MYTPKRSPLTAGFTLVELLTVIAIIAILMGILFPTIGSAIESAKKTQAKSDCLQIVNAVKAYYTEYGKYPLATADTTYNGSTQAELLDILRAPSSQTAWVTNNPRKIVFLEVPAAKNLNQPETKQKAGISSTRKWLDPWGNPYQVMIDGNYDNSLANPYTNAGSALLSTGVIAWSIGRDALGGSGDKTTGNAKDDVISWQ